VGQAYERLNLSPIGAVSGATSAVPLDRKLGADLLGFDGVIENTLDALIATDWLDEVASIIASAGTTLSGFVADLRQWSRDDVGTLVPG
jgi:argininosuccinate lyase